LPGPNLARTVRLDLDLSTVAATVTIMAATNCCAARTLKVQSDTAKKWAHVTELARQRDVGQRGRKEVAEPVRVSRDVNE
jgi:hypothetical protein